MVVEKRSEQPWLLFDFLPIQNVGQYHFHDVAKYGKISPKYKINLRSLDQNEEYIYLSLDEMLPW